MPHNITGTNTFTDPVPTYTDGDPVAQASEDPTVQALANRDVNLNTRLAALEALVNASNTTKAWGKLTGHGASAPTALDSYNINIGSSTGGGTGNSVIHVVFTTPMANANYAIIISAESGNLGSAGNATWFCPEGVRSTSGFEIHLRDSGNGPVNTSGINVEFSVLGHQ